MPRIKINILKARIRRNMLDKLSEMHYRDENSLLIQRLNNSGKQALVGIQREDGTYTALGHGTVYYAIASGFENEISIGIFLNILRENALLNGKGEKYEFIKVSEGDFVWVMNIKVMSALWNTMQLLALSRE